MADPVSWLMIDKGWTVLAADGSEVALVDRVVGDDVIDIFDGLAITTRPGEKPRYVPAEQVAEISEGVVRLKLSPDDVGQLEDHQDVTVEKIVPVPEKRSFWQKLGDLFTRD